MSNTFANTPEQILEFVAANPLAAKALENAKSVFLRWNDNWNDDASRLSGWGHNFACPKCSSHFTFTIDKPDTFTCPHCGTVASGKDLDEAWVYYYRIESAGDLASAALLALLLAASAETAQQGRRAEQCAYPLHRIPSSFSSAT